MHTHPINVVTVDLKIRELATSPRALDSDSPKANVVAVGVGQHAGASIASLQPGAPAEAKGRPIWDKVRIQGLSECK